MTTFDQFYFTIFNTYKAKYKQKANTIALVYTSVLQIALVFFLGCFFAAFFSQMDFAVLSAEKAWTLFILTSIGMYFKNWLKYGGKTRKVMNVKFNKKKAPKYNLVWLFVLPFICIGMGLLFLQAI